MTRYLHYVFDLWARQWRVREAKGDMIVVRYADDLVVGFEHEADARRFWDAMRERFERFSLELHGQKTRLLQFGRYAIEWRQRVGQGKPETFNFLGFTFICGRSRRGAFLLRRHTRRDRMRVALDEMKTQLRQRRHDRREVDSGINEPALRIKQSALGRQGETGQLTRR